MIQKTVAADATSRAAHARGRSWTRLLHPTATIVGSALGGGAVVVAAGALGAGVVGFATSIAVGLVLGGWAGGEFSHRRKRRNEAVGRSRSIRIFRITRTMRRRRLRHPSRRRAGGNFPRLASVAKRAQSEA